MMHFPLKPTRNFNTPARNTKKKKKKKRKKNVYQDADRSYLFPLLHVLKIGLLMSFTKIQPATRKLALSKIMEEGWGWTKIFVFKVFYRKYSEYSDMLTLGMHSKYFSRRHCHFEILFFLFSQKIGFYIS